MAFIHAGIIAVAIVALVASAATCGRLDGDEGTFCGAFYEAVGNYQIDGRINTLNDRIRDAITAATNANYTTACTDLLTLYKCAQNFPACDPGDGTTVYAYVCKSSCEHIIDVCPAITEVEEFRQFNCDGSLTGVEQDPSAPCLDLVTLRVEADGDPGSDASTRRWSLFVVAVAVAVAVFHA
jgi:gamma-glutamylcyclotransferase (GGCT)/AIG2-like uncharacterized protein YtfP